MTSRSVYESLVSSICLPMYRLLVINSAVVGSLHIVLLCFFRQMLECVLMVFYLIVSMTIAANMNVNGQRTLIYFHT